MALKTVKQYSDEIAERAKKQRQLAKLTQAQLSEHAGIPLSTYKRFEQRGLISFEGLIKVAIALRLENGLDTLFAQRADATEYTSLDDVEKALGAEAKRPRRRPPKQP